MVRAVDFAPAPQVAADSQEHPPLGYRRNRPL